MLLDFDPLVVSIAAQPFWLRWRDDAGRSRRHAPDLFARMADGSGVVIDVRPDDRVEDKTRRRSTSRRTRAGWPGGASGGWASRIRCWRRTSRGWHGTVTRDAAAHRTSAA